MLSFHRRLVFTHYRRDTCVHSIFTVYTLPGSYNYKLYRTQKHLGTMGGKYTSIVQHVSNVSEAKIADSHILVFT